MLPKPILDNLMDSAESIIEELKKIEALIEYERKPIFRPKWVGQDRVSLYGPYGKVTSCHSNSLNNG